MYTDDDLVTPIHATRLGYAPVKFTVWAWSGDDNAQVRIEHSGWSTPDFTFEVTPEDAIFLAAQLVSAAARALREGSA